MCSVFMANLIGINIEFKSTRQAKEWVIRRDEWKQGKYSFTQLEGNSNSINERYMYQWNETWRFKSCQPGRQQEAMEIVSNDSYYVW